MNTNVYQTIAFSILPILLAKIISPFVIKVLKTQNSSAARKAELTFKESWIVFIPSTFFLAMGIAMIKLDIHINFPEAVFSVMLFIMVSWFLYLKSIPLVRPWRNWAIRLCWLPTIIALLGLLLPANLNDPGYFIILGSFLMGVPIGMGFLASYP